jgi:hypothetical protein
MAQRAHGDQRSWRITLVVMFSGRMPDRVSPITLVISPANGAPVPDERGLPTREVDAAACLAAAPVHLHALYDTPYPLTLSRACA